MILRLFVFGSSVRADSAVSNLREILKGLDADLTLEVIDLAERPDLAAVHKILAAPTLLLDDAGHRRVIGDMSDVGAVRRALGFVPTMKDSGGTP